MKYLTMPRDPDAVFAQMDTSDDRDTVTTKAPMTVVFPKRYLERDMAAIQDDVSVVGIMLIATEKAWCLYSVCAMISLQPDAIDYFNHEGDDYVELSFERGSNLFNNINILQQDVIVYRVYKELLSSANIPFYMQVTADRDDLAACLDTAMEYAGTPIGSQRVITELIASFAPRNPDKLVEYFRQLPEEEQRKTKPSFVGMISASLGASNTLSRTAGAGFDEGLIGSMVYPTTKTTSQEKMVRQ